MIKKATCPISESTRLKIYKHAFESYKANHTASFGRFGIEKGDRCLSMCNEISRATVELLGSYFIVNRTNFSEFFSYKPKTGWKTKTDYWWTLSIKRGGAARRLAVLERLSNGLSKDE